MDDSLMKKWVDKLVEKSLKQQENLVAAYLKSNPDVRIEDVVLVQTYTGCGVTFSVTDKFKMMKENKHD